MIRITIKLHAAVGPSLSCEVLALIEDTVIPFKFLPFYLAIHVNYTEF